MKEVHRDILILTSALLRGLSEELAEDSATTPDDGELQAMRVGAALTIANIETMLGNPSESHRILEAVRNGQVTVGLKNEHENLN